MVLAAHFTEVKCGITTTLETVRFQRPTASTSASSAGCAIGFAYFCIGSALKNVRGPLDIALGAIAVLIVVAFLIYLHKAEDRFAARAEQAFPGELDDFWTAEAVSDC